MCFWFSCIFICSHFTKVPVLSLEADELIEPDYLPFTANNFEVVLSMSKPIVFTGAKAACPQLVTAAEEFHGRVKKACAAKKVNIGRVGDAMNEVQREWLHQTLGRVFHFGDKDGLKDQIYTASNLPEPLSSNSTVASAMMPSFWAS